MRWILLVLFTLTLAVVGGVLALNAGLLHSTIQNRVHRATGMELQLGPVRLAMAWPLRIDVGRSQIQGGGLWSQWKSLTVVIDRLASPQRIRVTWVEPRVNLQLDAGKKPGRAALPAVRTAAGGRIVAPVDLELWIQDGQLSLPMAKLNGLNFHFAQKQLMLSPAKANLQARLSAPILPGEIPVSIQTDDLTFAADKLKTGKLVAHIGGLVADIQGTSLLNEDRHRWLMAVVAPDLAKVAAPAQDLPVKLLSGALQVKAELAKEGRDKSWSADAKVQARSVGADSKWANATGSVTGRVDANLNAHFVYLDGFVRFPFVNGDVDLGAARVKVGEYLDKPESVPLKVIADAVATKTGMNLRSVNWRLAGLTGVLLGLVDAKAPHSSSLRFKVDQTSLDGLEKLIPPMRAAPLTGQFELDVAFNGDLLKPMEGDIHLARLDLRRVRGFIDHSRDSAFALKGPLSLNVETSARRKDGRLVYVSAIGDADLRAASLRVGPFEKPAQQSFAASFNVRTQGESVIRIQAAQLKAAFVQAGFSGEIKPSESPDVDLKLNVTSLDLGGLAARLPAYRDKIPAGQANGSLQIKGKVIAAGEWYRWPLATEGAVQVTLPSYEFPAAQTTVSAPAPVSGGGEEPQAVLPRGLFTERARINFNIAVNRVKKEALEFGPLTVKGVAGFGRLTRTELQVKNLFDGQIDVTGLETSLFETSPTIRGAARWDSVTVEKALAFAKPEAKDLAAGRTSGKVDFSTLLPSDGRFLSQLKVKGDAVLDPARLNTVVIGDMINQHLEKIPVKVSPVKVEPLNGRMEMDFDLQARAMTVSRLVAEDKSQSRLEMKGKIFLPEVQGDLMGTLALANPPVSGCLLEGNADAQGRLLIPLAMKGDLLKPGYAIISDVFGKLAGRAFECEKRKLVDRARQEGQKRIEKELKNAVKGLFGN